MNLLRRYCYIWILCILLFIIAVFVIPVGQFTDSADNLVGGCLISQGKTMYVDFFSHHGPFIYHFIGGFYKIIGFCDLLLPRYLFFILFCFTVFLVYTITRSFKISLSLILLLGLTSIYYSSNQILAETWLMNIAVYTFLLLFFYKKMKGIFFYTVFSIVQFSYITVNPTFFPMAIVLLIFFYIQNKHHKFLLLFLSLLPAGIFILFLPFKAFFENFYVFNTKYYIPFVGSIQSWIIGFFTSHAAAAVSMFIHPVAGIRNMDQAATTFETFLFFLWIIAMITALKSQKISYRVFVLNIILFGCLMIRTGGSHGLPLLFFVTTETAYFAPVNRLNIVIITIIFILLLRIFLGPYRFWMRKQNKDPSIESISQIVMSHTSAGDEILVYPLRPEVYLRTQRMPGSYYYFFLPWIAARPGAQEKVIADIKKRKVKAVIFENTVLLNTYPLTSYNNKILHYLDTEYTKKETGNLKIYLLKR